MRKKQCSKCDKNQVVNNFYTISDKGMFPDGRFHICKPCLKDMIDENQLDSVHNVLRMMNRPYIHSLWESCKNGESDTFGNYYRIIVTNKQYKNRTWNDSEFIVHVTHDDRSHTSKKGKKETNDYSPSDEVVEFWGYGFKDLEYFYFEKKYKFLRNNYPERTALHTEALKDYVIKKVKEELCISSGELDKASKWGKMASEAADAAKINPKQLSKADLSDGLDGFGQLVRSVEQAVDIIEILPRFKEKPQDKVDFTIWCYINYIRDLQGLPLVEYEDVYQFYEQRKLEYAQNSPEEEDIF